MRVTITRETLVHRPNVSKTVQNLARKYRIPVSIGRAKA
jgi:hypothetical protein